VSRQRGQVQYHQSLRVPAQGVLKQVRQLGVPIRYVRVVPSRSSLLAQRSDHIAQRTQTLVDRLRLAQPVLVACGTAGVQALGARKVDKIERAFAALRRQRVFAANAQGKDGVGTRGALVHQRGVHRAVALSSCEKGADLARGLERDGDDV